MIYIAGLLLFLFLLGFLSIYLFSIQFAGLSILTNLGISVLAAYITSVFLKKYVKNVDIKFMLLPFFLSFFVPILGVIISFFIMITIYKINNRLYEYTEEIYNPINLTNIRYSPQSYGASGAFLQLMKTKDDPIKRIKALFFLAQGHVSSLNTLLQTLLPDTSDEIRLLSFSILDQQGEFIEKDINKLLLALQSATITPETRAKLEKNVAKLYWELSYRHLVLKELEPNVLNKALTYALSAQKILKNDAVIWVLLGKIYYRLNDLLPAKTAFKNALTFNVPPSMVLPYLAEIQFKMKNYKAVQYYLQESDALSDIPSIAAVKKFWNTP